MGQTPGLSPRSAPCGDTELRHDVLGACPIAVAELIAEGSKRMAHARRHLEPNRGADLRPRRLGRQRRNQTPERSVEVTEAELFPAPSDLGGRRVRAVLPEVPHPAMMPPRASTASASHDSERLRSPRPTASAPNAEHARAPAPEAM